MKSLCLAACLLTLPVYARPLQITLHDGSVIKASLAANGHAFTLAAGSGSFFPDLSLVREMEIDPENTGGTIRFTNGDRLTFRWATEVLKTDTSVGRLRIPVAEISGIAVASEVANIALGKPVTGKHGDAQARSAASHLTDGDPSTEAKPPASDFDFRIDLEGDFDVERIVIHWGCFGDRFKGIPKEGGGWASAAWPGEYVTSYAVEYRMAGSEEWTPLHSFDGRPAEESGDGVEVLRLPTDQPGWSSVSTTTLDFAVLRNVAEVRIRAKGGHWIGLQELEVFGRPAAP